MGIAEEKLSLSLQAPLYEGKVSWLRYEELVDEHQSDRARRSCCMQVPWRNCWQRPQPTVCLTTLTASVEFPRLEPSKNEIVRASKSSEAKEDAGQRNVENWTQEAKHMQ